MCSFFMDFRRIEYREAARIVLQIKMLEGACIIEVLWMDWMIKPYFNSRQNWMKGISGLVNTQAHLFCTDSTTRKKEKKRCTKSKCLHCLLVCIMSCMYNSESVKSVEKRSPRKHQPSCKVTSCGTFDIRNCTYPVHELAITHC